MRKCPSEMHIAELQQEAAVGNESAVTRTFKCAKATERKHKVAHWSEPSRGAATRRILDATRFRAWRR